MMVHSNRLTVAILLLFAVSWHSSSISGFKISHCGAFDIQNTTVHFSNSPHFQMLHQKYDQDSKQVTRHQSNPETAEKRSNMIPEKKTDADLKEVLSGYYEGASFLSQEKAFRRVIRWKVDLEDIARSYSHVDWKKLSAVIKAETQGRTGNQVSHAKAVGITQIKYQGAWAFVWNAMFSVRVKQGSGYVKDYHNANIRRRYRAQLDRIRQYLEDNAILVYPSDSSEAAFREARSRSWSNLKKHLRREYHPGEYQVAVDIAAMYLDHLRISFHKIRSHVSEIKTHIENNGVVDPEFSGTKRIWWNRIKKCLEEDASYADSADTQARTLEHLNSIINRLEDPDIDLAAYNFGIRKVLEYIELGKALPETIEQYVKTVSLYRTIFDEIEEIRI